MSTWRLGPSLREPASELAALIETLQKTERRIEELTGGEVDAVVATDGQVFTLSHAQDQALQTEFARQAGILNALPANIALLDADGVVISVNEAWRHFADANSMMDPERGVGRNYLDTCDEMEAPDSLEIRVVGAGIRAVLAGREKSFSHEYACSSPSEERWFLLTVTPLTEGDGRGVVAMHLDVTERKLAERAAERALKRLREAQRVARIGDWDFDIVTDTILWSPAVFDIVGRDPALGPPQNYEENALLFDPASRERQTESVNLAISSGEPQEYELVVPRAGELPTIAWAVAVPVKDDQGNVRSIHGTLQDISVRRRAHLALEEREAELQEIQRLAGMGSWFIDFDLDTVQRSDVTSRIFSLPPRSDARPAVELSRDLSNVLTPESFRRMAAAFRKTRRNGDSYETELETIRPDGSRGWVLSRGEALLDAAGRTCAVRGTALDITERKRSELALAALSEKTERSERTLRALLSSITDFAYIYDREGRFVFVNQPLLDLWGMTLDDAIGKSFIELGYPAALAERLQREVEEVFVTKKNVTGETPYVSPAGVAGFYEYIFSPVIGANGDAELVVGSTRDITARKRVEMALRESEERFSSAFEFAPIAIALVSLEGSYLRVNRALCQLFGYSEEELLGGSYRDVTHPADLEASLEHIRVAIAGDSRTSQMEKRYVGKQGNVIDAILSMSLVRDATGEPDYFVAQIQDVTERKRSEDELRASNEKFLQLADNIRDIFWIRSADMQEIHYISPAFERVWGRTVESFLADASKWIDYVHPEDRAAMSAAFAARDSSAPEFDVSYRILRPDGEVRWVRSQGFPVYDDDGQLARMIGTVSDITEQQRAVEELRASELEFRTLAEAMPQIVWITRADGFNIYFNQQWTDYTGKSPEESTGDRWVEPFHPHDRDRAADAWKRATDALGIYSLEVRIRRADGVYRWWLVRGVPLKDSSGTILKWFGTCTDIHDMKLAELDSSRSNRELRESADALRISEAEQRQLASQLEIERSRLAAAQQVAKIGSWETDFATMAVLWSEETCRIFDVDPCNLVTTHEAFLTLVHPDDREIVSVAFANSAGQNAPSSVEHRLLLADGCVKYVEERWQVLYDEEGRPVRALGTCQDITDRRLSEIALQKSQERLREIFDGLGPSMFVALLTPEGILVEVNRAPLEAAGIKAEDVIGKPFADAHWWSYSAEVQSQLRGAIVRAANGEASRYDVRTRGAEDKNIDIDFSLQSLKDETGDVVFLVASASVITERKMAEGALRRSQKMEAVGQLAAGVAHEFNNILQALASMATITGLRGVSPEIVKIAAEMEAQIRRGAAVTRQLLLSSRNQEMTKTSLDLGAQVTSAAELLRRLIPENIALVVDCPKNPPSIEGDAGQIQQVLLNLAINARDAMPEGGTLTLRAASSGKDAWLEVEDDGEGFTEETREHLFEPFFTTKEVGKGTGLGLAVVYGIVEQHGGHMEVESEKGRGSLFRVILPRSFDVPVSAEAPPAVRIAKGRGRILLVEDEDGVREGIRMLLEIIGYEVIAVRSAEEATNLQSTPVPDLLLSDVSLPGMGGPALGQYLRQRWPLIGITLMTGYADENTRVVAHDERWSILQKPFEMADLAAHLGAQFRGLPTPPAPVIV